MKPLFDLSTLRNAAVRLVQRSSSFCLSRLWAVFADRGGMAGDDKTQPTARATAICCRAIRHQGRKNGTIPRQVIRETRQVLVGLRLVYGAQRPGRASARCPKTPKARAVVARRAAIYHGSHCQHAAAVRTDGAQAGHPRA